MPGGAPLPPCDLVVDGAYGTGFRGSYDAPQVPAGAAVLAIDIPSGVDADTGEAPGNAVRADRTVTFAALKPGLLQGDGPRLSGVVEVADIGIGVPTPRALLMEDADVAALLPPRPRGVNKWTNAVGVAAGSAGMEGSAILCTRGAMAAGAGMIRLGSPGDPSAPWPTEAVRMHLPAEGWAGAFLEATAKCKADRASAPGSAPATPWRRRSGPCWPRCPCRWSSTPTRSPRWGTPRRRAPCSTSGTRRASSRRTTASTRASPGPRPGEDRLDAARRLAAATGAVVLLKGPLTAVADPGGASSVPDVLLSAAGGPALATAGSGDVLSGIIGAFCARGLGALEAAALGAHVHGRAASLGPSQGLVAGDLPGLLARLLTALAEPAGTGDDDGHGDAGG